MKEGRKEGRQAGREGGRKQGKKKERKFGLFRSYPNFKAQLREKFPSFAE